MPVWVWVWVRFVWVTWSLWLPNGVVSGQGKKSTWFNRSCAYFKCQTSPLLLCKEIDMIYFFTNTSKKPEPFLQKKEELNYTNLASFLADISQNSAFHLHVSTLPATLCYPLFSEYSFSFGNHDLCPCVVLPGVPSCKCWTWHCVESSAASVFLSLNFFYIESICQ